MSDLTAVIDPEQLPEEPDEDPDFDPDDEPVQALTQSPTTMVGGGGGSERDWEYRTEVLGVAEVADGTTLVAKLTESAVEGWHLLEIVDAGDSRVLLLRRQRKSQKERRSVGFAPPGRA